MHVWEMKNQKKQYSHCTHKTYKILLPGLFNHDVQCGTSCFPPLHLQYLSEPSYMSSRLGGSLKQHFSSSLCFAHVVAVEDDDIKFLVFLFFLLCLSNFCVGNFKLKMWDTKSGQLAGYCPGSNLSWISFQFGLHVIVIKRSGCLTCQTMAMESWYQPCIHRDPAVYEDGKIVWQPMSWTFICWAMWSIKPW